MSDLEVRRGLVIPAGELREAASRSRGPGGQHVNKSSTRVTLRWSVVASEALSEVQRRRLLRRLEGRLTRAGDLVVHCGRHRSRARNRETARERLAELVRGALRVQRARTPTRPTKASKLRHRETKQRRARIKKRRRPVGSDSD